MKPSNEWDECPVPYNPGLTPERAYPELNGLRRTIDVSRRIIREGAKDEADPIIYKLVCDELRSNLPALERRIIRLAHYLKRFN